MSNINDAMERSSESPRSSDHKAPVTVNNYNGPSYNFWVQGSHGVNINFRQPVQDSRIYYSLGGGLERGVNARRLAPPSASQVPVPQRRQNDISIPSPSGGPTLLPSRRSSRADYIKIE